jgi:ADP-heptose:LPS heptosyltransferase
VKYDLIIDLWDRTSLSYLLKLKLMRPRKIIALRKPKDVEERKSLKTEDLGIYNDIIEYADASTFAERMLTALNYFPIQPKNLHYDLFLSKNNLDVAKTILGSADKFILVNFFGSNSNNTLPENLRISLINDVLDTKPNKILLNATNNQTIYDWVVAKIIPLAPERLVLIPTAVSILDIAAMITHCSLVVTTNTSLRHLAHALNCPVILLQNEYRTDEYAQFPIETAQGKVIYFDQEKLNSAITGA